MIAMRRLSEAFAWVGAAVWYRHMQGLYGALGDNPRALAMGQELDALARIQRFPR